MLTNNPLIQSAGDVFYRDAMLDTLLDSLWPIHFVPVAPDTQLASRSGARFSINN